MMDFIRSSLVKDRTAATETLKVDLPVNALSHLIISLDAYNATDEATLAEIVAFITNVTVTHSGRTITSMTGADLYALNCFLYGRRPVLTGKLATDNLHRCLSLIVPFGMRTFDGQDCYPSSRKGEVTLSLEYTAPATAADNGTLNIESVELVGASPQTYLKSVMSTISAPGATGENDFELPIGNDILAMLLRLTTWPGASSHTFGVDVARVLVDNQESGYASARAQCLTGDLIFHYDTQHGAIAAQGVVQPDNVLILDYDPHRDGEWALKTEGKSSVKLRMEMGVDEATYVTILERVSV